MGEAPTTGAVCTDGAAARLLCAGGVAQVLLGSDGGKLGALVAALRAAGPGRVAVFAGDPADAADQAAALAMAQEQFGGTPVLVSSPAQARVMQAASRGRPTLATP
jgi:D-serine deaminase-like pyridoxal phosphate-dependent protein